jgi:hypothetical protein
MASGIARSPWIAALAARLGWKRPRLAAFLEKNGMPAPFIDEQRAVKLLAKAGFHVAPTGLTREPKKKKKEEKAALKPPSSWSKKLVPRLARLLPEGDSKTGKVHVRKILRKGGYAGPRWDDEDRALAIFQAAGISIDAFEYADRNPPNSTEVVLARKPTQITFLPAAKDASIPAVPHPQGNGPMSFDEAVRLLGYCFMMLKKYERDLMEQIRLRHISALSAPLDIPIVVLNELRPKVRVS